MWYRHLEWCRNQYTDVILQEITRSWREVENKVCKELNVGISINSESKELNMLSFVNSEGRELNMLIQRVGSVFSG